MSQERAEKIERLQELLQPEFPHSKVEVVDGLVWVAIGRGEARRVAQFPLETLDAAAPEALERVREKVRAWERR